MKIGILTLPLHTNYGGILQAYALQTVLERMGHEVVVIDTPNEKQFPSLVTLCKRIIKRLLGRRVGVLAEWKHNKEYPIISQHTQPFVDKYIHRRVVKSPEELKEEEFDAIVVGSDQVWRPKYYGKIENAYLSFAKTWNIKRVAYAASFGTDEWEYTTQQTKQCGELLKLFDFISVREASAVDLCKENFNIDAKHVLDPTMLLDKEDYIRLFENANTPKSKGTLLNYILDETPEKRLLIEQIAKDKKIVPFRVNGKTRELAVSIEDRIQPSVEEWLRGFYDAEFVVTDSFHACVFSILFEKQFVVIGNENRGMARFVSLLKMFALEERLVNYRSNYKCLERIEYDSKQIQNKKILSYNYLSDLFCQFH